MLFDYWDYRKYLKDYQETLPRKGRGFAKKLSDYLEVGPVVISQTLAGTREFSLENAFKVSEFLSHSKLEQNYFIKLVEYQRAGHYGLKQLYKEEILRLRLESKKISSRYQKFAELSDEDKFIFYSDKVYSASRMLSSLPHIKTFKDIASHLGIPEDQARNVVEFLLRTKLCVLKDNKLEMGPQHTFIPFSSPYVSGHHRNWRLHSMQRASNLDHEKELMFTSPMSLSHETMVELKKDILNLIEQSMKKVGPSTEELGVCLTIDLLKF